MHDGRFRTLRQVIDFYDAGVQNHPQLDPVLRNPQGQPIRLNMTAQEKNQLLAFMATLTDDTLNTSQLFSNPFPIYLPEVDVVEVDDNSAQRNSVASITVKLDGIIDFLPGAITLVQRSDRNGTTGTAVDFTLETSVVDAQTLATIRFNSLTRNSGGVLVDGNYQLTLNSQFVMRDGRPMADDFNFGDISDEKFFVFYGDSNGDRVVDNIDLALFLQTYFLSSTDDNFDASLDYNQDNVVDNIDLAEFLQRYFQTLEFN